MLLRNDPRIHRSNPPYGKDSIAEMAQLRPPNFGPRITPNSSIISAPATACHHYIKRSSIASPAHPSDFKHHSSFRSSSQASCASSSGTSGFMNPLVPHVSPRFSSSRHTTSAASSASSAEAAPNDRSHVCIQYPKPIANVLSNCCQGEGELSSPPAHALPLSHLPPKPSTTSTRNEKFAPSLHPIYPVNLSTSEIHLEQAMKAEVVDGFGKPVKFEDLIDREFRTLVIFIRHFRCGYSQRYIKRLSKIANSGALLNHNTHDPPHKLRRKSSFTSAASQHERGEKPAGNWISANGVKIIVIGNGKYQLIDSYRSILNCPFPIYTDLSKDQKVYKLLGMKKVKDVKILNSLGYPTDKPISVSVNIQAENKVDCFHNKKFTEFENKHLEPLIRKEESRIAFLSKVILNALRMPWKWSGDPQQLGGEIVFEPMREERRIKRKPIKYKFVNDLLVKSNSIRSNSSLATSITLTEESPSRNPPSLMRRPSCSIKNNSRSRSNLTQRRNLDFIHESVKDIQIQCKFIHQMTNFQDHFSIDELMMLAGIRLTALIHKCAA